MTRPVELNKTWLPGPSRGTQTFNAPSNLTIPYGRHKATISGRAGSGNNPGAQYSVNYNVNYNIQPVIGNQPEAGRPENAWTTNYVQNIAPGNPYATQYNILYSTNYAVTYSASYGVSYNVVDSQYNNVAYPAQYNVVDSQYSVPYSVSYNVTGNQPATAYSTTYGVSYSSGPPIPGNYNPSTGFNYALWIQVDTYDYNTGFPLNTSFYSQYGTSPDCPSAGNVYEYNLGGIYVVEYTVNAECSPFGNNQNYSPGYNTNYNVSYPETAWITNNNTAYNTAYNLAYNRAYSVSYNSVYGIAYNRGYSASYNASYGVVYNIGNQPEVSRPINAYGVNSNITYNIGNRPAIAYSITYNTNYNFAYPQGNTPFGNYVIDSYAPGAPGDPSTVLGVYFPGGAIGSAAPYVGETVVKYWDYPDYKTHPVSVPPGGQIVVKLE